jgi:hypothetical protein
MEGRVWFCLFSLSCAAASILYFNYSILEHEFNWKSRNPVLRPTANRRAAEIAEKIMVFGSWFLVLIFNQQLKTNNQ